jgi:hypothetical protein
LSAEEVRSVVTLHPLWTSDEVVYNTNSSFRQLSTTEEQPILEPAMKKMKKNHAGTPFQWLWSLSGFSTMPRQRPRRLAKVTFSHRLDRDEAMGICYTHFDELLSAYESPDPRRLTPIIATAISPIGSGKSFFLDEVGELRPVDVDKFCKSKWAPALKSAVTISISFSGFSNVENAADRDDRALCARMLYRCISINFSWNLVLVLNVLFVTVSSFRVSATFTPFCLMPWDFESSSPSLTCLMYLWQLASSSL